MFKKSYILLTAIIIMSLCCAKVSNAGIINDFFKVIGIETKNKTNNEDNEEVISKVINESLDDRQKEVVDLLNNIYKDIQELNVDGIEKCIDYKIPKQVVFNLKEFFADYSDSTEYLKSVLLNIKYKIDSVKNDEERVITTITYSYPQIEKIIKKVIPEILLKNASIIFGGQITNETINSVLESIARELKKGDYELSSNTREFAFKKVGNEWKLVDVDNIVKDAIKYINEISSNMLK